MAEKNGTGQKRCRERERRTERKEKSGRQERQCYGSRKFLELMVHNKRLSVPKLIMSVHAGLISFPAFNKYVAMVIRHNFSTRRDLVREHRHVYTRECANTVRVNLTRIYTKEERERRRRNRTCDVLRWYSLNGYRAMSLSYTLLNRDS